MTRQAAFASWTVALGLFAAGSAAGQDDAGEEIVDREPIRCVPMGQVQSAVAANDDSVLFYRSGGQIYVNILEQQCRGLRRSGQFTYRLRSGIRVARLCDTDSITVMDPLTNSAGVTCRLGVFHPITDSQADEILNTGRVRGSVVAEPVEPPEEAGAEKAE